MKLHLWPLCHAATEYIFISRSTLTYRALYYGKIETQTSYIYIYIYCYAKIIILEHFSLTWMLLEAGGTVFIINSKYIWRKLTQRLISKQFCIISVFIHSQVQWRMDVWSWNQPLIGSIRHIDRQGKNQLTIGMPRWNKNSKVQILGKSKPLPVKSRSEMHFWIKHESAPKHLHSHLK